jgi:putative addiction module CopG family antidote
MRSTQQFSITLPHDMAKQVERKVESGDYASVSEVVRDGIRTLLDRDAAVEKWLREEVVKGIEEYRANPASAIPSDQIMDHIRDKKRRKAGRTTTRERHEPR